MATKAKSPTKKTSVHAAKKAPAKKVAGNKLGSTKKNGAPIGVIKHTLNKSQLIAHLVEQSGLESKSVKAVLSHLETTVLASVNKKGIGQFALPGLFKINVHKVPAKPKRFGKDPFSGEERWFPPKPASVKVKIRPLKKLKDAAQ
jgi:nucleoid DNA-binding protein